MKQCKGLLPSMAQQSWSCYRGCCPRALSAVGAAAAASVLACMHATSMQYVAARLAQEHDACSALQVPAAADDSNGLHEVGSHPEGHEVRHQEDTQQV